MSEPLRERARRHSASEAILRGWLKAPWGDFAQQWDQAEAQGLKVVDDADAVEQLGPKGALKPERAAVVLFEDDMVGALAFGEIDLAGAQGLGRMFFREFWLFKADAEEPWFEFLSEEFAACAPHLKVEETDPPVRSWLWLDDDAEGAFVRLSTYADGGARISQMRPI